MFGRLACLFKPQRPEKINIFPNLKFFNPMDHYPPALRIAPL